MFRRSDSQQYASRSLLFLGMLFLLAANARVMSLSRRGARRALQNRNSTAAKMKSTMRVSRVDIGRSDDALRRKEAEERTQWEEHFRAQAETSIEQTQAAENDDSMKESTPFEDETASLDAATKVSELMAVGAFETRLHESIGGLDHVLSEIKRRVWTPLAAPPQLLKELGIQPVRGLLLYGRPGCGKSLLAQNLGQILSPLR
jgi:SpoVK/Ycf46/Vps4 family AAA+-type ATPase